MGYKLKRILIYPDGVTEKQVYPAGWEPTSSTIAYFPFKDDQLDKVGDMTFTTTGTKESLGYTFTATTDATGSTTERTRFVIYRAKLNSLASGISDFFSVNTNMGGMRYNWYNSNSSANKRFNINTSGGSINWSNAQTTNTGTWYQLAYGVDSSGNYKARINGTLVWSGTATPRQYDAGGFVLTNKNSSITLSELIVENRLWEQSEVTELYNQTKSTYGL